MAAHGELVESQAFCDVCGGLQPLAHFEPEAFIEAHPFAARGITAGDLRDWRRGWGGDGRSGHRALRLQLERRARTSRGLEPRPNVLDSLAKGVRAPQV